VERKGRRLEHELRRRRTAPERRTTWGRFRFIPIPSECPILQGKLVEGGGDPVPSGETADKVGVGIPAVEFSINGGDLLVEGGVADAFDGAVEFFEEALGGIEFGHLRRQKDQRRLTGAYPRGMVAAGVLPDQRLDPAGALGGEHPHRRRLRDVLRPRAPERAPATIHGENQIAPLSALLDSLADLHPTGCPHPPYHAHQLQEGLDDYRGGGMYNAARLETRPRRARHNTSVSRR
jgi:hypothetical protein